MNKNHETHIYEPQSQYTFNKIELSWVKRVWLKIILHFIKTQTIDDLLSGYTIIYKEYKGIKYYISQYYTPPLHWNCRCATFPIKHNK